MLEKTLNNPKLKKFTKKYEAEGTIFIEGESSQDLYILVSGKLDVLKGDKKITLISKPGSLFGEMSFLLGDNRTATVRAHDDVTTICIPKEQVSLFLIEFPDVSKEITQLLAQRLDDTSRMLFGLKELTDQLPDAVILVDRKDNILTCNKAAEELYGRESNEMRNRPVEDIYEEPEKYKEYIKEVRSKRLVREQILRIQHPDKGTRYISTSTTLLYDGCHEFQGVLSLGRDVTGVENLKNKYRRSRYWFIPSIILLGLMIGALLYGYPYFTIGYQSKIHEKLELRDQIARDCFLLKSLLLNPFSNKNKQQTSRILSEFFSTLTLNHLPYTGILLLNDEKKVFDVYVADTTEDVSKIIGSSYTGIEFIPVEDSSHSVLSLYRVTKNNPMGEKYTEIAFELRSDQGFLGWLVFQMKMDYINTEYGVNEQDLKQWEFKK